MSPQPPPLGRPPLCDVCRLPLGRCSQQGACARSLLRDWCAGLRRYETAHEARRRRASPPSVPFPRPAE